ncbi:UDP-3-O-(3-hydroxymyristoyl)glucosamine N-acyltransferase [Pseudohalioglobus lutimaris]|uniref:UDP-3-O-acylglucosamine N-acyltransferase n=1 Tax=Pseudohalioglobus lutimaris TaxID=1737061 RepID=A0A2N5X7Q3_9GAMM|nr:UDP-3-O-(3-hydroxymyristoyl)glucosamine N-acyltransferase [Pseudohalioglobus lutimaris]PLW70515.1 UDP-3-O-(3-hydroxymyristoyl)glucosamine N-acyltransferase [Pseudohalioglobus lutimaris]
MSLGELAQRFDLELSGDPDRSVSGLATLASAGADEIGFLSNKKYVSQLATTRAAAVILHPDLVDECPVWTLATEHPYVAFARITAVFDRSPPAAAGIHPSAVVSPDATIAADASIGPNAVVEAGAGIGAGALVGANAYIGHDSFVGAGTRINPGVVIYHDVRVGERCQVHSQAVLGADGFGFAPGPEGWEKIHQLGGVRIGNDVEIGACTTIDRGALDHTVIEDGAIIDNLVQIAHNCHIGKNTAIAGCTGLAGSTIIGANCTLAGGVGVVGHVEICDGVHVTGMTMVTRSITEPGSYSSGTPMAATRDWRKNAVRFSQLERIQQRLAALEKQQH